MGLTENLYTTGGSMLVFLVLSVLLLLLLPPMPEQIPDNPALVAAYAFGCLCMIAFVVSAIGFSLFLLLSLAEIPDEPRWTLLFPSFAALVLLGILLRSAQVWPAARTPFLWAAGYIAVMGFVHFALGVGDIAIRVYKAQRERRLKEEQRRRAEEARKRCEEEQRRLEAERQEQMRREAEQARRDQELRWRLDAEAHAKAETERRATELKLRLEDQRLREERERQRKAQELREQREREEETRRPKNRLCTACGLQYPMTNVPVCPNCRSITGQTEVPA